MVPEVPQACEVVSTGPLSPCGAAIHKLILQLSCTSSGGRSWFRAGTGSAGEEAPVVGKMQRWYLTQQWQSDDGMTTVEYAVGTVVAAAFAAVLYRIVTGDSIVAGLTNLVSSALSGP